MNIAKVTSSLIKIESEFIQAVLDNPSDFSDIILSGNINCCINNCEQAISTFTLPISEDNKWMVDLTTAVQLNNLVAELVFQNTVSLNKINTIVTPIDLSYVEDNCSVSTCTLQDFSGYFAPLFKTQIDNWFTSVSISSNVTVSFNGNILILEDLPINFRPYSVKFGVSSPYTEIQFGYGTVTSKIYLLQDGLYVLPGFFNLGEFVDGVYRFDLKYNKSENAGFISEANCAFIDYTIKCKVASVLQNILTEAKESNSEETSTILHLIHYALTNDSNCGCNCDQLCEAFRELVNLLSTLDPNIINQDCGCQ